MPISKPQALEWQTGPPRGMDFCNMAKLVRNTPGEKYQHAKRDNTIINLTQKTQELSICAKSDEFGQIYKIKNSQTASKDNLKTQHLKKNHPVQFTSQLITMKKTSRFWWMEMRKYMETLSKLNPKGRKSYLVNMTSFQMEKL
ncbi:hypothetical protein O181_124413 [Austropuccinia psidii MF-1]|uniref:Uncharacterized protein n=1 Tax=Austropuccinia psidii MF-1 TaxID=1389203 RepID=A0A9Q3KMY6_9BASI|nr:hypothetical protein [Austropuccinia psidii MF-1]